MEKTWWLKWGLKSFFNSFIKLRTLNIVCQLFRITEIKEEWQKRVKTDLFLNDDYDKCKGWYQESNRKASQQQVPFGQWVGQWPHLLATGLLGPQRELQAGHCSLGTGLHVRNNIVNYVWVVCILLVTWESTPDTLMCCTWTKRSVLSMVNIILIQLFAKNNSTITSWKEKWSVTFLERNLQTFTLHFLHFFLCPWQVFLNQ